MIHYGNVTAVYNVTIQIEGKHWKVTPKKVSLWRKIGLFCKVGGTQNT